MGSSTGSPEKSSTSRSLNYNCLETTITYHDGSFINLVETTEPMNDQITATRVVCLRRGASSP
ncbi:hypothetical protein MPTK1_4g13060 [Marchantia polymorpha subsp. ruderalis]|uniref:Uncharacterized protein n=2 Tax=Marchantia polymorpha TaxID=3197 RepID=A0AAF6B9E5_MARPO|nr:hypothetical protein MARPO_0138s0040 [Marchantia polymorpha]BBN08629.1 hypothetical protein Mp_4g13060 [Marchantia polymorpha subsp. ruderalis]|eukprot:PTQ29614.1 hypothetical protein MARPO_0138s0040 [Marchantia polymorpha]